MATNEIGAEGGHTACQYMVGFMYYNGRGVDVDYALYAQALAWTEKAAVQDWPTAVGQLGVMCMEGKGVTPSWRRAREYYERAIALGNSSSMKNMQTITESIQNVTSHRSSHSARSLLVRELTLPHTPPHLSIHLQIAPLMDKRVELHGTSRADMNGKRGIATDFHPMDFEDDMTWRYTVKLDGSEAVKVKPVNLRAVEEGGGVEALSKEGGEGGGRGVNSWNDLDFDFGFTLELGGGLCVKL